MSKGKISCRRRRELRGILVQRDGARCWYCRSPFLDLDASTIDHLVPRSHGGSWSLTNLVLACGPCNEAKADRPVVEFIRPKGYMPGLRPRAAESVRQGVTSTARAGRTAALVPSAVVALALILGGAG